MERFFVHLTSHFDCTGYKAQNDLSLTQWERVECMNPSSSTTFLS